MLSTCIGKNFRCILFLAIIAIVSRAHADEEPATTSKTLIAAPQERIVNKISIVRKNPNKYLTQESIASFIPFKEGEPFDRTKTNAFIKKLYQTGYFEHVAVRATDIEPGKIDLFIVLKELPEVVDIELTGNSQISDTKIEQTLKLSELRAINQARLNSIIKKLKKLYQEKDYHLVDIDGQIKITPDNKATIIITIKEGGKSLIKRIYFKGNTHVSEKMLKKSIFTREDWLFGFMSKAGSFQPDKFEKDKRYLENYYKTLGYLTAKVTDATVTQDPTTKQYSVTFTIQEGDLYHIKDIHVQGTEQLSEQELLRYLPIKTGMLYSIKDIMDCMEKLKDIFGDYGYLFIDVQPNIVPDEVTKTVNVSFDIELGKKVHLGRLTIKGNKKTREHVIRRKINIAEGELISHRAMEASKERVEALSFWEHENGVTWKTNRVNDETADLELLLKEAKTGKIYGTIGYGGNQSNPNFPSSGFNGSLNIHDINFLGKGLQASLGISGSVGAWATALDFTEPYFMDYPVALGFNFHFNNINRSQELDKINDLSERFVGSSLHAGYITSRWTIDTIFRSLLGFENISLNRPPSLSNNAQGAGRLAYQKLICDEFRSGTIYYLTQEIGQDCRNHIIHPSGGFQWGFVGKLGAPIGTFGFFKLDADYSWYTSLIDEYGLTLGFHTHAGYVRALSRKCIPYNELYNIGGPATVRGFEWGEISPTFNLNPGFVRPEDDSSEYRCGEPIGGRKAFYINLELSFPIKRDYSIKGALFYDGGSGWCPPALNLTQREFNRYVCNSCFDYRQSIGIGIRMVQPQPLTIDWGFKLDRRPGESPYAVHFGMYREF